MLFLNVKFMKLLVLTHLILTDELYELCYRQMTPSPGLCSYAKSMVYNYGPIGNQHSSYHLPDKDGYAPKRGAKLNQYRQGGHVSEIHIKQLYIKYFKYQKICEVSIIIIKFGYFV